MIEERKFKVLSLDGGGIRGYLSAKILKNLEEILNKERNENINIGQRFDLIVGTSTGGIIASALSIGKSANEIYELYESLIPEVFVPISKGILEPKYSNKILEKKLKEVLEERTLGSVDTWLCLTSVDVENSSPRFHKSDYFNRNASRLDEKLINLALATSAAPSFFPLVNTKHSTNLADGGIVANNPSLVGLIDAMQIVKENENFKDFDISLISIGTGEQCHMPYNIEKLKSGGKMNWIVETEYKVIPKGSPLLELLMDCQSKLAHYQTQFLLQDNYLRINPKLSISIELDSVDKMDSLKNLADLSQADLNKINKLI